MEQSIATLTSNIYSYSQSPGHRRRSSGVSFQNARDTTTETPLTPRDARRASLADGIESPKPLLTFPGSFGDPEDNPSHSGLSFLLRYTPYIITGNVREALDGSCTNKDYGDTIPFYCSLISGYQQPNALDFIANISSTQAGLGDVVSSAAKSHEMARDISSYEFALRDLKIRVAASGLKNKRELTRELIELIKYTDEAVWAISAFTANLHKSTEIIIGIDEDAASHLRALDGSPPLLLKARHLLLSAFNPFSAFTPSPAQQDLNSTLLSASSRIAAAIEPHNSEVFDLHNLLTSIDATLYQIELLVLSEQKMNKISIYPAYTISPSFSFLVGEDEIPILPLLWNMLSGDSDSFLAEQAQQHHDRGKMLRQISEFYDSMSAQTAENLDALWRISHELKAFRDGFAVAPLVLRGKGMDVIRGVVSQAGKRLGVGRRGLESVEGKRWRKKRRVGERPRLLDG